MDLEATISQAIGPRMPAQGDWPSNGRTPDGATRKILTDEMRTATNDPSLRSEVPNLRFEISKRYPDLSAGPASDLFDTVSTALNQPTPGPAAPRPTMGDKALDVVKAGAEMTMAPGRTAAEFLGTAATGAGQAILGGWRGLATLASGGSLEEAARQVHSPELAGGQTAAVYEPAAGSAAEAANKVVGLPGDVIAAGGRVAGRTTMDITGSPAAATAVETGINAVPLLLLKSGKTTAASKAVARENVTAMSKDATNYDVPTVVRNRQAQPVAPEGASPNVPEARAATQPPEVEKFTEPPAVAPEGKAFAPAVQAARAAVLKRVGVEEPHPGAISGNAKEAATEYQQSKVDSPSGDFIKAKFDAERQALQTHGEQIVRDTGGTPGVDAHALEARGHVILQPLEGFRQWFTDKTTGLYNEAKARAQGQPFAMDRFKDLLATDSKFANTDTIELRKGIKARMQELNMIDKDGNPLPASVEQAEELRKYVGEEWSPKSNGRIRELKNAIDEDVAATAGEDIYKQARALHAMKEAIFSDPKGLSSILDSEGGINRKVPFEKIGDTISALPNAQFEHIVKTLRSVPPELKASADAALAEIKAHMASRLIEAAKGRQAQWGAKDVTAYLNKNAVKFESVFTPEEMAKIRDLNDAGHILRTDTSYPGAAVQKQNLLKRGALGVVHSVAAGTGALVGSFVGAPRAGAAVASEGARAFTSRLDETAALREAQKRWVPLTEVGAK